MFQITFSEQSLKELNKLSKLMQMDLVEKLSTMTIDILKKPAKEIGVFQRDGKYYYRLRAGDFRLYFDLVGEVLRVNYILQKDTWSDFAFRCKLPVTQDQMIEEDQSFWKYLESLGK